MASRFEKFSERARRVLALAQEEATQFNITISVQNIFFLDLLGNQKVLQLKYWLTLA